MRLVIFRRETGSPAAAEAGPPAAGEDATDGSDLRVSGEFSLDGRDARRFVEVPAAYLDGFSDLIFDAHLDASTTFYGIRLVRREGLWRLLIPRRDLDKPELGTLYYSRPPRPAARLTYATENGKHYDRVVLSFGSEDARTAFLRNLLAELEVDTGEPG